MAEDGVGDIRVVDLLAFVIDGLLVNAAAGRGVVLDLDRELLTLEQDELAFNDYGDAFAHAKYMRNAVIPKMVDLRTLGEVLEAMADDDIP